MIGSDKEAKLVKNPRFFKNRNARFDGRYFRKRMRDISGQVRNGGGKRRR